jgi:hypothetical protein
VISSASALAHARQSGPRLADAYVGGLPVESRLSISCGEFGIASESRPAKRTCAFRALRDHTRRCSSRELLAGRRRRGTGMLRGGSRIAWNGLVASIGWRRFDGRISRTIVGDGGSGLADGPCEDLSQRIHVRTSLTLAREVSLALDDAICRVFQRMLLLSSNV